jgi:hypothetical protein
MAETGYPSSFQNLPFSPGNGTLVADASLHEHQPAHRPGQCPQTFNLSLCPGLPFERFRADSLPATLPAPPAPPASVRDPL